MTLSNKLKIQIVLTNISIPLILGVIFREIIVAVFNPHINLSLSARFAYGIKPVLLAAGFIFSLIILVVIFYILKPLFKFLENGEEELGARKAVLTTPWFLTLFHMVLWIIAVTGMYALVFKWNSPGGVSYLRSLINSIAAAFLTGLLSALTMNALLLSAKIKLTMTEVLEGEKDYFLQSKGFLFLTAIFLNMAVFGSYMTDFYYTCSSIPDSLANPAIASVFLFSCFGIIFLSMHFLSQYEDRTQEKLVSNRLENLNASGGDLRKRIVLVNFDSIGLISNSINKFLDTLAMIVERIRSSSMGLKNTGGELFGEIENMEKAMSTSSETFHKMSLRFKKQKQLVEDSILKVSLIKTSMATLDNEIADQTSVVEESSAAVEQILGTFKSSTANLKNSENLFLSLKQLSEEGKVQMKGVVNRIAQVKDQASQLEEANSLIAGIAAQTNLLAMNAAIEAAHAGNAGLGFAVVADEIRKLAEHSSLRSKEVSSSLKSTGALISLMDRDIDNTSLAFDQLKDRLDETHGLQKELLHAMDEQEVGSSEVLTGLSRMKEQSTHVQSTALDVLESSNTIHETMDNLNENSREFSQMLIQSEQNFSVIEEAITLIEKLGQQNNEKIRNIEEEISHFKV